MPREVVIPGINEVEIRDYSLRAPKASEVIVQSEFASNKHGTLFRKLRGDPNEWRTEFERTHRLSQAEESLPEYPRHVGNMAVGRVTECGSDVTAFAVGDRVYGHLPMRERHVANTDRLAHAPAGMSAKAIVYTDPATVGVHLVREGDVNLGDAVGVFGAGAIGQMTAQLARLAGAKSIAVSEPTRLRRRLATDHGADLVVDPTAEDAARQIKTTLTAGSEPGVDRAFETSAAYAGLNDAVRAVAYGGTVASCAYYEGDASRLALDAEFHRNAIDIRSIQPGSSDMLDYHPRWTFEDLRTTAFRRLRTGDLSVEGLIDPVVSLDGVPDAIESLVANPADGIKLGVRFES